MIGSCFEGELSIPQTVEHERKSYLVTVIGDLTFYDCSPLTGSLVYFQIHLQQSNIIQKIDESIIPEECSIEINTIIVTLEYEELQRGGYILRNICESGKNSRFILTQK